MRFASVRGFSLIELLIVAAVMALFFGGLFVTIQTSLKLITDSRGRMSALSVVGDRLEYIRSLSYDAVGTVSGLPNGMIPQTATSTLNGFLFTERTLVEYVDDAADGIGAADSNGITTDYKRVKIEISWSDRGVDRSVTMVSNIVPRSIETNAGGGTIRVNVTDANVLPVAGASVRLVNTTGTSSIDVTKSTDSTGVALFGGAPAGAGYQIFVTRPGYSSVQTHVATTSLPNPSLQPISVIAADISTVSVQIDALSTVLVRLLTNKVDATITRDFATSTEIASTTGLVIEGDMLALASSSGLYFSSGVAMISAIAPSPLARWRAVQVSEHIPAQTARRVQLYASTTPDSLIPDSVLAGNSTGFVADTIDISALSTAIYPELVVAVTLDSTNNATTSRVDAVTVHYTESETPFVGSFTWRGTKTIGTLIDFSPVYKHDYATTTDSSGERQLYDVEWDTYQTLVSGYDVAEACPQYPYTVIPNTVSQLELLLTANSAHSLRVVVTEGGRLLPDATVTLTRSGSTIRTTSLCGQAYFAGLSEESDYSLTVSASGFSTVTLDPFSISGDVVTEIAL